MEKTEACPECKGAVVQFKGKGLDMQYRVCTKWKTLHGKTREEVGEIIHKARGGRTRFA